MRKDELREEDDRPVEVEELGEEQQRFTEGPDETAEVANDEEEQTVS
jgi:hypothetical protein